MSRICDICARGSQTANTRSHSNIASKRLQKINLQKFKVGLVRKLLCTNCIKTINKQAA
ncbi:MAG: L28 family ribosomal protein [Patescibacteria group bacterium]